MTEPAENNVSVSKEDYAALKNAHDLLNKLWNDKDKSLDFKKMVKAAKPDANIPELDIIEKVTKPYDDKLSATEAKLAALEKKWEEDNKARKDKDEEASFEKELNTVKSKFGFTDDGWKKVIDRMQAKKNPDAEAAAEWVKAQEPKAKPTASSSITPQAMNMFGIAEKDEQWADLNKNPIKYADKEITNIINNPENYLELGGTL